MAIYVRVGTASLRQLPFDFTGNAQRVLAAVKAACQARINVLLLPELVLSGYGCEDNFTFQEFNQAVEASLAIIIEEIASLHKRYEAEGNTDAAVLVALGMPLMYPGGQVFNATAIVSHQGLHGFSCKQFLARNGLHYEPRWFEAWTRGRVTLHPKFDVPMGDIVVDCNGIRIGFETCEDSWISNRPGRDLYQRNVDIILNPSASHFAVGKYATRKQFVQEGSRAFGVAYAYANLSGTETGTSIFDAGCLIASEGRILSYGDRLNTQDMMVNHALVNVSANRVSRIISSETIKNNEANTVDIPLTVGLDSEQLSLKDIKHADATTNHTLPDFWASLTGPDLDYTEICYAIGNGLWDWMTRTKTNGYVVSLSGGADSGLAAVLVYLSQRIAYHQLGEDAYRAKLPDRVQNIAQQKEVTPIQGQGHEVPLVQQLLPKLLFCLYQGSENSSNTTYHAAKVLAQGIGATFRNWDIQPLIEQYCERVNGIYPEHPLSWDTDDITLQNIQARVRSPGVWMIANRENKLLIATSNLSESALGYATMDGDTSGVLSAISGLAKSTIRKLNRWLETTGVPVLTEHGCKRIAIPQLRWINEQQPTAELRPDEQTDEDELMPYEICDFIMDCYLIRQMWPKSILVELVMNGYGDTYTLRELAAFVERWFKLFCRNPWKRYGTRAGFHVSQISLDPKTFHRFPLLNSGFAEPLARMWDYVNAH